MEVCLAHHRIEYMCMSMCIHGRGPHRGAYCLWPACITVCALRRLPRACRTLTTITHARAHTHTHTPTHTGCVLGVQALGAVRPRLFSISSGPSAFGGGGGEAPRRLSITVAIVEYQSKTRMQRQGLCTSFLKVSAGGGREDGGDEGGRVPIWVRDGSLRVPKKKERDEELGDLAVPLILVGPGTGLAPLRAFLQERAHVRQRLLSRGKEGVARDLLFFGCRKREEDYLYQAALEGWLASGDLAHLGVAFSRESPAKVYVQHKIREAAAAVWAALEAGGVIMVSGASEKMPQDVREAFVSVVEGQAGQDREFAEAYVKRLEAQRRYLQDTWG